MRPDLARKDSEINYQAPGGKRRGGIDRWMLLAVLVLLSVGLLMVASASMVVSDHYFGNPFHFIIRQAIYLSIGLVALWVMTKIPVVFWQKYSLLLLGVCVLLLVLVLIPGIGRSVNGSRRWLAFPFFTLQVTELVKLVTIVFLANYISRYEDSLARELSAFARPLVLLSVLAVLILLEPDFGTVAVLLLTSMTLLFLAGAPVRPFLLIAVLVLIGLGCLIWLSPYRWERMIAFVYPWKNQFGSGYQLTQSLIAFGRGGVFGVGLGNSMQKLFYLPEAHTDFLFAVLAEELGLVGVFLVLLVYVFLIARLISWGRQLSMRGQTFVAFLSYGVGIWLMLQVLINVGVTLGLLPTKGLTLPFISYGGTSLIISCAAIGIVLRAIAENRGNYHTGESGWAEKKQRKARLSVR